MLDTIIENAHIYDGLSTRFIETDLAIAGDRIALLGDLRERDAYERVDGAALSLAPGFIDVHSHSDELWLADGRCEGKIRQGVTTEIGGNCGSSIAPLRGLAEVRKAEDAKRVDVDLAWTDLDGFFSLVESSGVALNVATLVGLGTTRRCIRGDREGRLEIEELTAQTTLIRETIEQGALGVSSGLIYIPSRYADRDELAACAVAAREAGMPRYVSHLRDEGDELLESVEEALWIGHTAEVAVQLSHHKAAWKRNWGKVHRSLELAQQARTSGLPVGADVYPYVAMWTDLDTLLPPDARDGGRELTLEKLNDPQIETALALRLELDHAGTWHDIAISNVASARNAALAGMRLDDIASAWHLSPPRAALRLMREERLDVEAIFFAMSEDDVASVLSADFVSIGSDASARALEGPTARGVPHPRTFGCFPRVFGRYVGGRRTLDISEAIRRMTSLAADQFGIANRGRIEVGAYADLVLFDADRMIDTATYDHPYSYPLGIDSVWVNGKAVVRSGESTGARPGRALRGGR
jgi:N-acyl-D-amino-acid deacylase